jgi:hypothetical protein
VNKQAVGSQLVSLCKRYATNCATKWFFAQMSAHMLIKFNSTFEEFTALLASEQTSFVVITNVLFNSNISSRV